MPPMILLRRRICASLRSASLIKTRPSVPELSPASTMLTKIVVESFGIFRKRLGEARTFVHVLSHLGENDFEAIILGLIDHGRKAIRPEEYWL